MQTQSTCYKGTRKMTPKGILWHSTGANNPNLKRYVQPSDIKPTEDTYTKEQWLKILGKNPYNNDWNHIERQAGLNCWIGKLADGTIAVVQTMPWDYRPWGCGSGSRGSCNSGWMQFEICEDNLASKDYFEAVYKEACEITAYYCKMYNIDPKGTVVHEGVTVPTILCHHDSYKLGLGSNHGDVDHWFKKYGKTMADVREDVAELLAEPVESPINNVTEDIQQLYRVRRTWTDKKSQKGAFKSLDNAKVCCEAAGTGYKVFDREGFEIYSCTVLETAPPAEVSPDTLEGDEPVALPEIDVDIANPVIESSQQEFTEFIKQPEMQEETAKGLTLLNKIFKIFKKFIQMLAQLFHKN